MAGEVGAPPFVAFRFEVAIVVEDATGLGLSSPLCSAAFSECSGIEASMAPKTIQEGGNNREQVHLLGPLSYGQLTLKRGMTPNLDLWKWFAAVSSRRAAGGARGETDVRILAADGTPVLGFRLSRCLPVKLKAPTLAGKDGGLAVEEMTLTYARFQVHPL